MSEAQITDWLASQRQAMIDLLRDVVNIDSGSYDKAGVDAVGARFERHFSEHGIPFRRESHDSFGDAIHADVAKPGSNEKPVLLMGHRDTVFGKGEAGTASVHDQGQARLRSRRRRHEGRARRRTCRPRRLQALSGGAPGPLRSACSPGMRRSAARRARGDRSRGREAGVVSNSEPGRPNGGVVTGRKGGVFPPLVLRHRGSGGGFRRHIRKRRDQRHRRAGGEVTAAACAVPT